MNFLRRTLQRLLITTISLALLWFIVTQLFARLEQQMPVFFAGTLAYFLAAYVLLPRLIHLTVFIFRRGRIPRVTRARDGLPADPINIVLIGSEDALISAFKAIRWHEASPLTLQSSSRMIHAVMTNRAYVQAPFSTHYLFGRGQDHGFQQPIGKSPRTRHHIRFWGANFNPDVDWSDIHYWTTKHVIRHDEPIMWVGSATKDTGLGITRLTYQITHRVDRRVDEERDYIIAALRNANLIAKEHYVDPGKFIIRHFVSDGRIFVAELSEPT